MEQRLLESLLRVETLILYHVELLLTQAVLEPLLGVDILERVIVGL